MAGATGSAFPLSSPERIGRYEILLPIGTGGMATVYLARTRVMDDLYRNVALKLMHQHLRTEEGTWAAQLVEEARLAASIRHPNVVPVLEVGDDAHGVFLVMDYVEGDTVAGVIRAARAQKTVVPPPIVARIMADALTGLHAAHELTGSNGEALQLVHRDFSPQNVLVGTDGISRLTDFGIAKVKTRVGVTASGVIKGKIGYMAPEQALGRVLDRRCDVWAAGVMAWELLAMRRLYPDDDQVAALLRLVSAPPPRIRSVCPQLPPALDEAIASALQVEPQKRCPSALELRRRLLDAWRPISGVADNPEVAEYVQRLVGGKLSKREQQASAVLALRAKISRVSARAIAAARDGFDSANIKREMHDGSDGTSSPEHGGTPDREASVAPGDVVAPAGPPTMLEHTSEPERRPDQRWMPAVGAGLVLVAAALFSWSMAARQAPSTAAVGTDAAAAASSAAAENASSASSKAAREASSTAADGTDAAAAASRAAAENAPEASSDARDAAGSAAERTVLVVHADLPITGLKVGDRGVALVTATREVEVQLAEQEWDADIELTATARGGRRVSTIVSSAERKVELRFPDPPKRLPGPPAKPTGKKPPGLAPTPYEK